MTKTESCRIHLKKRFKERFDLDINRHDIRRLVGKIRSGENILSEKKLSNHVSAYDMIFLNRRCTILYDHDRKVPVTVLKSYMRI